MSSGPVDGDPASRAPGPGEALDAAPDEAIAPPEELAERAPDGVETPWLRLHPLTPLLRGGRVLGVVLVIVSQQLLRELGPGPGAPLAGPPSAGPLLTGPPPRPPRARRAGRGAGPPRRR